MASARTRPMLRRHLLTLSARILGSAALTLLTASCADVHTASGTPAGVGFDGEGNVIAAGVRRTVENYSFLWLAKYAR